jgi:hypothetical protein
MSRRMIRGPFIDGVTVGLRCSLEPYDALTDDSSIPGQFSFDSTWADFVKPVLKGTVSLPGGSHSPGATDQVIPHGLGYTPFYEARLYVGAVIYDDYFNVAPSWFGSNLSGVPSSITNTALRIREQQSGPLSAGVTPTVAYTALYIIFPVPLGA